MSYTIEEMNGCTKKFLFDYDQVDLSKEIKEALLAKQKDANLKGFRKGKAPLDVVQKFYGPQIESDALYRFVSNQFYDVLKKENIRVIGYPKFGNTQYEAGKKVSFEATVEVLPEITLKDYSAMSFKREDHQVKDSDLDELRKNYLSSKAQVEEVKDDQAKLALGQFAVFNFQGTRKDGSQPENMKATDYMLEIGTNQFIAGFEEAMVGMKKGEKKDITLNFPADYHQEDLRGEPVTFHVELLEIKQKNFPEFNDEIAKEFGFESVSDFEKKSKIRLELQKRKEAQTKLQQEILEKLISQNSFDIPLALLEDQKKGVRQDLTQTLKGQGFNEQMIGMYFEKWDEDITKKADFQVRSGLILDKLAKDFKIEASESDFNDKLEEMIQYSGLNKEEVKKYYSNANVKRNLMYAIREEKTFSELISKMKVS